jgi:hypothetical protein
VRTEGIDCVLAEPQFNEDLVATILDGTDANTGVIDPLGADLEPGPVLYGQVIRNMATLASASRRTASRGRDARTRAAVPPGSRPGRRAGGAHLLWPARINYGLPQPQGRSIAKRSHFPESALSRHLVDIRPDKDFPPLCPRARRETHPGE